MTKFKSFQLFSVLICVKMLTIICTSDISSAEQMAGTAVSTAVCALISVPMLMLYKNKFDLQSGLLFGRLSKILYVLFFIVWGAKSLGGLWETAKSVYFPIDSSLAGALILTAVCLYTASFGLKAVPRAAGFMFGLMILSLAVIIAGALPRADAANFAPIASASGIIRSAVHSFCGSGELVMLFVLLQYTEKSPKKGVAAFFIGSLLLSEIISVIEITVLGKIIGIVKFPFFTAGAFSQPLSIQRADALYMLLFTMLCVTVVTLQIVLSVIFIGSIFPRLRYKGLVPAVLMLALSWLTGYIGLDLGIITGAMIVLLAVILPVLMYIRRLHNENNTDNNDDTAAADGGRL